MKPLPIHFVGTQPDRFDKILGRIRDFLAGIGLVATCLATWYFTR